MNASVIALCPVPLWESLAREDASATFFQTPTWHRLAESFEGTRSVPLLFDFGTEKAVLPVQERRGTWGRAYTGPFGTYAALICTPGIGSEHLAKIAAQLSGTYLDLLGSPFARHPLILGQPPVSTTRILRLETLEAEAWEASWSRNHRRLIRSARDAAYTVRLASGVEDVSRYYAIYRGQTDRWGAAARRIYPEALFQDAFRLFPPQALRIWLAEMDGEIVAGRMCLYHNLHAVEWHAAAEKKALERGVNHLLIREIVQHALELKFGFYDFNPNPGLKAVDHFKRGFNTEALEFAGIRNRPGLKGALAGLRDRLRGEK